MRGRGVAVRLLAERLIVGGWPSSGRLDLVRARRSMRGRPRDPRPVACSLDRAIGELSGFGRGGIRSRWALGAGRVDRPWGGGRTG